MTPLHDFARSCHCCKVRVATAGGARGVCVLPHFRLHVFVVPSVSRSFSLGLSFLYHGGGQSYLDGIVSKNKNKFTALLLLYEGAMRQVQGPRPTAQVCFDARAGSAEHNNLLECRN